VCSYVHQILLTKSDSSECAHLTDGGYSLQMKYGAGPSDNLFKTRRNTFRIRTMNRLLHQIPARAEPIDTAQRVRSTIEPQIGVGVMGTSCVNSR
jgi:hypothetical protein